MEEGYKVKGGRALRAIGKALAVLAVLAVAAFFFCATHTQVVVGAIQVLAFGDAPVNSYEPLHEPYEGFKDNGQYLISELSYANEYPNSFLDITYPDDDLDADRPTLVYFHGGGFFGGSKAMGDPLAASEATYLLDDLCAEGYNLVNVDYALVPDERFPVPLVQANQALAFVCEHAEEYHLDTGRIVLMGSSAGAIIVSQYAAAASNPAYAELLGIEPAVSAGQIAAVVADDAPLIYEDFTLGTKFLVGNYVAGTIFLDTGDVARYDCIPHMVAGYPPAIMLGSEYRHDMAAMHEALDALGVDNELVDPYAERGEVQPHCFVASERVDETARDAFERLVAFLAERTRA